MEFTPSPPANSRKGKGISPPSAGSSQLCVTPCSPHRALHSPHTWLAPRSPWAHWVFNEFCNKKGALGWLEVWFFISQSYLTGNHAVMTLRRQQQLPGPGAGSHRAHPPLGSLPYLHRGSWLGPAVTTASPACPNPWHVFLCLCFCSLLVCTWFWEKDVRLFWRHHPLSVTTDATNPFSNARRNCSQFGPETLSATTES